MGKAMFASDLRYKNIEMWQKKVKKYLWTLKKKKFRETKFFEEVKLL